jgi:phospholipid transport system substrate-binding protein
MKLSLVPALALVMCLSMGLAQAQESPETMIRRGVEEVTAVLKSDPDIKAGNRQKINALIESKIMPHVSADRMTRAAVGRHWGEATDAEKQALVREFKALLTNTYAGAFASYRDDTVIAYKPVRSTPDATEAVVRSLIKNGSRDAIQLDYYMERIDGTWKVFDFDVLGVRVVEAYKGQFGAEASAHGIDGLIRLLAAKNRAIEARGKA